MRRIVPTIVPVLSGNDRPPSVLPRAQPNVGRAIGKRSRFSFVKEGDGQNGMGDGGEGGEGEILNQRWVVAEEPQQRVKDIIADEARREYAEETQVMPDGSSMTAEAISSILFRIKPTRVERYQIIRDLDSFGILQEQVTITETFHEYIKLEFPFGVAGVRGEPEPNPTKPASRYK